MNKGAGLAVLLAVAAAAVRLTAVGAPAPAPRQAIYATQAAAHNRPPRKPLPASSGYLGGCSAYLPDPGTGTYPKQNDFASASTVLDSFFRPPQTGAEPALLPAQTTYAVAIVPDPRHTNLSVMFDRQMVAIQQAAGEEGYTYNSSWLPWSQDAPSFSSLADQQRDADITAAGEACPGVLLFRKNLPADRPSNEAIDQALVVLVVGEQPTGGINPYQWHNAIHWLQLHTTAPRKPLRVLGPTFSGSMVSLANQLKALHPDFPGAQVLSGGVSSCSAVQWFVHQSLPAVTFGTFQESDELHIDRFLRYLAGQKNYAKDTAILSEDETAYGQSSPTRKPSKDHNTAHSAPEPCETPYLPENRPLRLFYPRDMSALRLEYQKEGVFASTAPSGTHQNILQDGAEPAETPGETLDTIQNFSGPVTPLAQEAVLFGIISFLRAHSTRYIILRCTNPLDDLFLTRFFHRAYPEARIVLVGQDLLLRREVDTTEFRGVLSLSNYPLLPRDQHWTTLFDPAQPSSHSHLAFESSVAQGTYNAARYTFDPNAVANPNASPQVPVHFTRKPLLPGYTNPFWMTRTSGQLNHPPTWLTAVGRDGFWPVAVLDDISTSAIVAPQDYNLPGSKVPSTMVQLDNPDRLNYDINATHLDCCGKSALGDSNFSKSLLFSLPFSWKIAAILAFLLVLYQAFAISPWSHNPSSGLLSVFRRTDSPSQHALLGLSCVMALTILLEVASIFLALPSAGLLSNTVWQRGVFWFAPLAGAALLLAALRTRRLSAPFYLGLALFAAAGLLLLLHIRNGLIVNPAVNVPLFYRMAYLTSGVSPLLAVLFISAGFYLWTWQALAGNLLLCPGRPTLPELSEDGPPSSTTSAATPAPAPETPTPAPSLRQRLQLLYNRWIHLSEKRHTGTTGTLWSAHVRVSRAIERRILAVAPPLTVPFRVMLPALVVAATAGLLFTGYPPLLGMEGYLYRIIINLALLAGFVLTLTEAGRLFFTWNELRPLLSALNRMRLRRTFAKLRAVPASSLWGMSGNVQRVQYHFFSSQLDAATRLASLYTASDALNNAVRYGKLFAQQNAPHIEDGPLWNDPIQNAPGNTRIREVFAGAVADILEDLLWPTWRREHNSLSLDTATAPAEDHERNLFAMQLSHSPRVRAAEEFVCFHYIAFIQNVLARMRTMVLSMACLFVALCLAIAFYPFVPRTQITLWLMLNLFVIASAVIYVYANLERDETLSYITNTKPGQLSPEFWIKTLAFLAGPVFGILTTQFPAISDSILSWLQPGIDSIK